MTMGVLGTRFITRIGIVCTFFPFPCSMRYPNARCRFSLRQMCVFVAFCGIVRAWNERIGSHV
jgi:hypothetical protein